MKPPGYPQQGSPAERHRAAGKAASRLLENQLRLSDICESQTEGKAVSTTQIYLLIAVMIAAWLLRKTWALAQKGSASRSHQLMRFRVMAQFLVVGAIVVFVYFTR